MLSMTYVVYIDHDTCCHKLSYKSRFGNSIRLLSNWAAGATIEPDINGNMVFKLYV